MSPRPPRSTRTATLFPSTPLFRSISPDHAVTSEPLLAERIEVLKGPATLLDGGGAIGGVVNVIDKKIPIRVPEKGYEGELELRANSVANEGDRKSTRLNSSH